jgi:hypothetical protein
VVNVSFPYSSLVSSYWYTASSLISSLAIYHVWKDQYWKDQYWKDQYWI